MKSDLPHNDPKFAHANRLASELKTQYQSYQLTKEEFRKACLELSLVDQNHIQWTPIGNNEWYFRNASTPSAALEKWSGPERDVVEDQADSADQWEATVHLLNMLVSQHQETLSKLETLTLQFERFRAETLENQRKTAKLFETLKSRQLQIEQRLPAKSDGAAKAISEQLSGLNSKVKEIEKRIPTANDGAVKAISDQLGSLNGKIKQIEKRLQALESTRKAHETKIAQSLDALRASIAEAKKSRPNVNLDSFDDIIRKL